MSALTITVDNVGYLVVYDLDADELSIDGGEALQICLPSDPGERGYGYSHGSARYRAAIDAIRDRWGWDDAEVLAARERFYGVSP